MTDSIPFARGDEVEWGETPNPLQAALIGHRQRGKVVKVEGQRVVVGVVMLDGRRAEFAFKPEDLRHTSELVRFVRGIEVDDSASESHH